MYITVRNRSQVSLQRHEASDNIRIVSAKFEQIDGLLAEAAI